MLHLSIHYFNAILLIPINSLFEISFAGVKKSIFYNLKWFYDYCHITKFVLLIASYQKA